MGSFPTLLLRSIHQALLSSSRLSQRPVTRSSRRRSSMEVGKGLPAIVFYCICIPHCPLTSTKPHSRVPWLAGRPSGRNPSTLAAKRGGDGWSYPPNHFPHRRYGYARGNAIMLPRPSFTFLASLVARDLALKSGHRTTRCVAASSEEWTVFLAILRPNFEPAYLVAQAPIFHNNCMAFFLDMPSVFPCILFHVLRCLHVLLSVMKLAV